MRIIKYGILIMTLLLIMSGCGGSQADQADSQEKLEQENEVVEESNILLEYIVESELSERNNYIFTPDRYDIAIMEVNGHNITEMALEEIIHHGGVSDKATFFNNNRIVNEMIALNNENFPEVVVVYVDWKDRSDVVLKVYTVGEGRATYWETAPMSLTLHNIDRDEAVTLIKHLN